MADIARRHNLVLMSDEIYEKILFADDVIQPVHHHTATFAGDDVLCLTFSGLSKAYRVCGYRAGWVMVSGPKELAADFLEGLTLLANMRMCANVPGQHAIQTALGGYQSIEEYIHPGGRFYEQSKTAWRLLNEIPGVSCVEPHGALYCFPRLDPEVYPIEDDQAFVIDLLRGQEDPRHPRHRLQLVRARPLPARDAARHRGPHRGDRADRGLPGDQARLMASSGQVMLGCSGPSPRVACWVRSAGMPWGWPCPTRRARSRGRRSSST